MNTQFNTIETIRTNSEITNKTQAYLYACNQFERQASDLLDSENASMFLPNMVREVSLAYHALKNATCGYSAYTAAHSCEVWLSKCFQSANVNND
jgi:hypothetical protein